MFNKRRIWLEAKHKWIGGLTKSEWDELYKLRKTTKPTNKKVGGLK